MKAKINKILFVIGSLQVGGAERQLLLLAEELVKRGAKARLFVLQDTGPLRTSFEAAGVPVHVGGYDYAAPRWAKGLLLARAQLRLLWLAATWRPQVLHAFLPLTNCMGALAGRLVGVRAIVTSRRAMGTHQDRHPLWRSMDRLANRLSSVITANSQAVVDDTILRDQVDPAKIRLIYNGLEFSSSASTPDQRKALRQSLGLGEEDIALVYVANLIPYKGHAELIQAFEQVCRKYRNLKLFLIGEDRGIGGQLSELAEILGVAAQLTFLGRRNDVTNLLSAMDIGVMASHEEGFSNALLEKLAAGLPVVATAVGGNPEALSGLPGCVLVPAFDVDGLASGIERVVSNSHQASNEAEVRRNAINERYSVKKMINSYEQLYAQ